MKIEKISIFGLGYIGLPTAVLLAQHGAKIIGVDVSNHVVDSVNAGKLHIIEPYLGVELKKVVENGSLHATLFPEAADAFIIAVPTPFTAGNKPDISYIKEAALALAPVLHKGSLVILESTSPVGTTETLADWLAGARQDLSFPQQSGDNADVQVAYCPERVLPGKVLQELVTNDRVVGGMSVRASEMATALYRLFVKGDITVTNARTAEMCKLTENSFRDVNIAFANELSIICDKLHINVWELIALANRHPRVNILQPGCGVGGHCIAVDPWFIVDSAPEEAHLIRTARGINDFKPLYIFDKVKVAIAAVLEQKPEKQLKDLTVSCLGLAFKPDIDDLRESPAVQLIEQIATLGCKTLAVEPHIKKLPATLEKLGVELCLLESALRSSDIVCITVKHTFFLVNKKNISMHSVTIDAIGLLDMLS